MNRMQLCATCKVGHNRSSSYCASCHASNMRMWRATHPLTSEQRVKDNARSYAGVYKRRGKLSHKPCGYCGGQDVEMHHDDYSKPLDVDWLCRPCHLRLHNDEEEKRDQSFFASWAEKLRQGRVMAGRGGDC